MHIEKLHGPPGTGKTHALIDRVRHEIEAGIPPEDIGYYSFTRAAANEAQRRISADGQFTHFRTIHSECFHLLGLIKENVIAGAELQSFARTYGYEVTDSEDQDIAEYEVRERVLRTLGDYLLFFEEWRKNLRIGTEEAYCRFMRAEYLPIGWSLSVVRKFQERYVTYKNDKGLYDFSDMLMEVLRQELTPGVSVLVLDEAQDCSPLQLRVISLWLQDVERHYIAGDPYQAIYQWQGSNPELFAAMPADRYTLLDKSFRLPRRVYELSRQIIAGTPAYQPRDAEGYVVQVPLRRALDFTEQLKGSAFLLVRNRYLMAPLVDELYLRGVPFGNLRGSSPFRGEIAGRVLLLRKFLRNEPLPVSTLAHLLDYIPQKPYLVRGLKAEIKRRAQEIPGELVRLPELLDKVTDTFTRLAGSDEYLDILKMAPHYRAYFRRVLDEYGEGALTAKPLLTLGTIHSVKGMEADHVIILPDMARRTYNEALVDPVAEARVWYVAVTRAREGVTLVDAQQIRSFQWPKMIR